MNVIQPSSVVIPTHDDPAIAYDGASDRTIDRGNGYRLAVHKSSHTGNPYLFDLMDDSGVGVVSGLFNLGMLGRTPQDMDTYIEIVRARVGSVGGVIVYLADYDLSYVAKLLHGWRTGWRRHARLQPEKLTIIDNREPHRNKSL